ncbi:MAG TPA: cytochrome c oxidase subunit II [Gemmatimonadota bacterium]|nr:cytochrome c oxidase subunit II [Gemmatimonadota bacterium]
MRDRFPTLPLLAGALAILAAGCAAAAGPEWATLEPVTDFARQSLAVYDTVFWWTLGIFVVVEFLLVFALWRFRHRPGDPEVPAQVHGHTLLEVGWTLAPALILFFIAIPTVRTLFQQQAPPSASENALEIAVVGHQWWWEFIYPDLGITTANEMHVPVGRKVHLTLTSADVIHSFWVPRLGGKRDLNPGRENTISFIADSSGMYDGQCAELCGTSHANMRLKVFVDEPDAFAEWVRGQRSLAAPDSAGFQTFLVSGCAACHAIGGTLAQGRMGPDLTRVGSRTTIAGGILPNTPQAMSGWLRHPDSVKPGALMPDLNMAEDRISTLVGFLQGLR